MLLLAWLSIGAAAAVCRLPVPDGGDEQPSKPNLQGRIVRVVGNELLMRQARSGDLIRVRLPEKRDIYTAFGGDGSLVELAPGQRAWVWFKGCKWPKEGIPVSAYIQINPGVLRSHS